MRRVELVRAVRGVIHALRESRVHEALAEAAGGARGTQANVALLSALRAYSVLAAGYGGDERRVVEAMGLKPLDEPAFWARAVAPAGGAQAAGRMAEAIRMAAQYLPRILALVSRESMRRGGEGAAEDGMAALEVVVIETERQRSSPVRLITALESVWLLYDVAATLRGVPGNTLSVTSCDSGSDKSFDFLGLAPAVETMKEILLSVWDRVVFYRGKPADARVEMIERSVPVLNRIARMREAGELGPEQAELLRRGVVAGVKKFLDAGCTIPEIETAAAQRSRDLLAPAPRLLAAGPAPVTRPGG